MYVGYGAPGTPGARVVVLRGGVWTELVPPGWENTSNDEPDAFFVDSQNRLWFAEFYDPGVYRYDPMLVNTNDVFSLEKQIHVFPNPASDVIYLQMTNWENQQVQIAVRNAQGGLLLQQMKTIARVSGFECQTTSMLLLQQMKTIAGDIAGDFTTLELPANWPAGIYYLEAVSEKGERQTGRFVRAAR